MARKTDPVSLAALVGYKYTGLPRGMLLADDAALTEIDDALQVAERSSDDIAVVLLRIALGLALVHHDSADRQRGFDVLAQLREICIKQGCALNALPIFDVYAARETAAHGDLDGAVRQLRAIADEMFETGHLGNVDMATVTFVEALLARGGDDDLGEAEAAIDRFEYLAVEFPWAARDVAVLRLRALLSQVHGEEAAYQEMMERYRAMATSLGYEGHMKWAEEMAASLG